MKLLYLADREALLRWGRPITTDRYVAMEHGPVVSGVYSLISSEPMPGSDSDGGATSKLFRTGMFA